jgi:hypothetical protein
MQLDGPLIFGHIFGPQLPTPILHLVDGSLNARRNRKDRKTTKTNATRIDPNDDLRDYDIPVAMWLARYSYDDYADRDDAIVESSPPSSFSTDDLPPLPAAPRALGLNLGPVRISLGISVPIVWLANMACDFRGAYELRDANFYDDDDNDNDRGDGEYQEWVPIYFDSREQLRFKVLQLAYSKARRGNDVDVVEEESVFVLSPRMIITSRVFRRRMRDTLVRYLENDIRLTPHPGCRSQPQDAQGGDVVEGEHPTSFKTSMMAASSTSITTTITVTETTTARGTGKKKVRKGKKKKGKKCKQEQQHERPMSNATVRSTPYEVQHYCGAKGKILGDYGEGGQGLEYEQLSKRNDMSVLYTWCCDYCRMATFPTYQMAMEHERLCPAYLKLKEEKELDIILNDICAMQSKRKTNATRGGQSGGGGSNVSARKGKTNSKRNGDEDISKLCGKRLSIIDDDQGSTSESVDSSSSSSSSSTTKISTRDEGHSSNEPHKVIQIGDDDEEEWTHLPPKQSRKTEKCNNGNKYAASLENLSTVAPTRTTAQSARENDVTSNGKENSKWSRNKSNIPDVSPAFLARGNATPSFSAKHGRALDVATTTREDASDQSSHNIIITSSAERSIAEKNDYVMKSSTIDYDDRVNDTALPQPNHDSDLSSTLINKPMTSIISTLPLPQKSYATAVSTAVVAEAEARPADDITNSSLLLRVSYLTSENETLSAQNHLLIKRNETLLEKLAEAKRQSIEAVQHVHLKAYIAETARSAAEERATRLESILLDLASDITIDVLVRREIQDAISGNSSSSMSQVELIDIDTATRTRARLSTGNASMPLHAPLDSSPLSSAADGATNPSPLRFERILSRLRRGDHASQMS